MPERLKSYLWVGGVAIVAILAWLLADVANSIIESSLNSAAVEIAEIGPRKGADKIVTTRPESYFDPIIDRNIFDSRNVVVAEDSFKPGSDRFLNIPEGIAVKSNLPYILIGTAVHFNPEDSGCTIMDDKKIHGFYKIGDQMQQVTIAAIKRKRVEFLNNGVLEYVAFSELALESNKPSSLVSGWRPPSADAGGGGSRAISDTIVAIDENRYIIDRREVENAFDNLNNLLREARVIPDKSGFKFVAIKRNSIYSKLGLKRGDVLQRVNGVSIETPEKAFQVFQQLKNQDSIVIDLVRGGVGKTLEYEIR